MWKKTGDIESDEINLKPEGATNKKTARGVSTIGTQAVITGEIKGNEDLLVMGNFDGTIILDNNVVTVGKNGKVKGKIQAKTVTVEGRVDGDLTAREKIVLKASAKVKANIVTARLVMDDGCHFQGGIDMSNMESKPAPTKAETKPNSPKPVNLKR